ncbi:hypothetical protein R0J90_18160, partial [Micrococcus sp. SIMBA_144]
RNIDRAFNNLDPFERLENGARQAERTIGRSIRNLPEHLEGFHGSINTTRGYLRDLGRNGSDSIDELADAAIRARVGVERIGSASS